MTPRQAQIETRAKIGDAFQATFLHQKGNGKALHPPAAIVLAYLRKMAMADKQTVVLDKTGRVDSHAMAFNEGKRFLWLQIEQLVTTDPAKLRRMIEDQLAEAWE